MPRPNAARREDLEKVFHEGHFSQNPGPVAKPSVHRDDLHDNHTSGAGILIRRAPVAGGGRKR